MDRPIREPAAAMAAAGCDDPAAFGAFHEQVVPRIYASSTTAAAASRGAPRS